MSNFRSKMIIACILGCVIAVVSAIPISSYAEKQTDFVATLSGKNVVPPVNTPATGTAKFHLNPNGTLSYEVDVNNIKDVVGVPVKLKNGAEVAQLLNVYATVGGKSFTQSLGPVSGKLSSGVINANDIYGPLIGKNITDLLSFFTNKSANVIVRTTENQPGEIEGQILPGAAAAPAPASASAVLQHQPERIKRLLPLLLLLRHPKLLPLLLLLRHPKLLPLLLLLRHPKLLPQLQE
jgi:hypothetical protein